MPDITAPPTPPLGGAPVVMPTAPPAVPPVTTVATATTTTTTTTSGDVAVQWYRSQRFIILCQSSALLILAWLGTALATNDWAWRTVAVSVLGNVVLQLKDWWSPTVVAPFASLNKNNVDASK